MKKIKAYKVFNPDWTCRGFKYEIGKTYKLEGNLKMCQYGFHACTKISNCFNYYDFDPENKVAEVELSGTILGIDDSKQCASIIKIVKKLSWNEMLILANTGSGNTGHSNSGDRNSGDWNSGDWNSGDRNSGYSNSGYRNSGHSNSGDSNSGDRNSGDRNSGDWNSGYSNSGYRNSGDWNSGDWNSCNFETGCFNSEEGEYIRVFNKKCKRSVWEESKKPSFLYFGLTEWIYFNEMTDEEKKDNPKAYICDGYLKVYSYKEAWAKAYNNASKEDIKLLKNLPNFNSKVFEEITGIKIK